MVEADNFFKGNEKNKVRSRRKIDEFGWEDWENENLCPGCKTIFPLRGWRQSA